MSMDKGKTHTYTIDEIKEAIKPVAHEYGVKQITLFGSYAKGEATPKSDIDLHLVDYSDPWGYFKLLCFRQELELALGIRVDVLTTGAMDNEVLEKVRQDGVLVFEQQ